jgi:hypothetical protein
MVEGVGYPTSNVVEEGSGIDQIAISDTGRITEREGHDSDRMAVGDDPSAAACLREDLVEPGVRIPRFRHARESL